MQTFLTAIIAFASTNIDDIFVLMALFSHVNHQTFRIKHIVVGQFIGILSLTVISFIGALGLFFVPVSWIGLLGLIPLYIGVKGLLSINKSDQEDDAPIIDKQNKAAFGGATLKVAAITIGNGGDNIAIYIPIFATSNIMETVIVFITFSILIAVWCFVGYILTTRRLIAKQIEMNGKYFIPIIFIFLGLYILYESGTYNLL
ncbi:MAG: cadmium resistance transporter [Bacillaceae bacterium]|nr:cadmium resistance transporter [Bacillaceae bacterium]